MGAFTFLARRLYSRTNWRRSSTWSVSENRARSPLDVVHVALLGKALLYLFSNLARAGRVLELEINGWSWRDGAAEDTDTADGGSRKLVGAALRC